MTDYIKIKGVPFDRAGVEEAFGEEADRIWEDGVREAEREATRMATRAAIRREVADTDTFVGDAADMTQLCLINVLIDAVVLKANTTFASYRTAKLKFMDELAGVDVAAFGHAVIEAIKSGETRLTAGVKGPQATLEEALERMTRTALILERYLPPELDTGADAPGTQTPTDIPSLDTEISR